MGSTGGSFSGAGSEPKDYFLAGDLRRVSDRVHNRATVPKENDSSRMWITTMPQSVRCSSMHIENKSVTPSEKACLLVSRRRPCPTDRGNLLWKEVKKLNTEYAQIRTLWTDRGSKSSPTVRRRLEDTNSRSWWPKKYTKIKWNDRIAARRTFSRSSRRTSSTRSTTPSWTVIEAKLGFTWSSWEKVSKKGKVWRSFKVPPSTLLQDEDWSRIRTLSWNSLEEYRNCKMK